MLLFIAAIIPALDTESILSALSQLIDDEERTELLETFLKDYAVVSDEVMDKLNSSEPVTVSDLFK